MNAVERIRDYFNANASTDLKKRVEANGKTPEGALAYCASLARKKAVNQCACIDDDTVFGWAMHYFEDEDASKWEKGVKHSGGQDIAEKPSKPRSKRGGDESMQMDLFGFTVA